MYEFLKLCGSDVVGYFIADKPKHTFDFINQCFGK